MSSVTTQRFLKDLPRFIDDIKRERVPEQKIGVDADERRQRDRRITDR